MATLRDIIKAPRWLKIGEALELFAFANDLYIEIKRMSNGIFLETTCFKVTGKEIDIEHFVTNSMSPLMIIHCIN
jgi:hypothetical protein